MKIDVMNEKENELFSRKELELSVSDYSTTPAEKEVVAALVAKFGTNEENIVIDGIMQEYGRKHAVCTARIYKDKQSKETYETKKKVKEAKAEEKKPEPKKEVEEKPKVEKPKQEVKPEEPEKKEEVKQSAKEEEKEGEKGQESQEKEREETSG